MSSFGDRDPLLGRWFVVAVLLAVIAGVASAVWLFGVLAAG